MSIDFSNSLSPIKVEMRWYASYPSNATLTGKKMINIEKNIPLPSRGGKGKNKIYEDFDVVIKNWAVGDSITFPYEQKKTRPPKEMTAFVGRARTAGQKVATRSIAAEGVMRMWRIE
jgi:hypothetical protein